ncbi:MAG: hypothetical protein HZA23_07515 [Nitrospirae bacterium]|nr:hypothetical protein [Nitrospirota bacterium]
MRRCWKLLGKFLALFLALIALLPGLLGAAPPSEEQRALVERVAERVSQIRGLPLKEPIRMEVADQESVRRYLRETIQQEYPGAALEEEGRVLTRFGLLPPGTDYRRLLLDLYTEQIGGYYDRHRRTLYLADWIPDALQEHVLSHEVAHALQDQHYDLRGFLKRDRANDDLLLARAAVLEGDGLAVMLEYLVQPLGQDLSRLQPFMGSLLKGQVRQGRLAGAVFARTPRFLQGQILFPYLDGLQFVLALHGASGWKGVDRAYRSPPASTEQILHPKKYLQGNDPPRPVTVPALEDLLGSGWRKVLANTMGELGWRLLIQEFLEESRAEAAASGWGGDRFVYYEEAGGKRWLLVSRTVWDTFKDAEEFFTAYREVLAKKAGLPPPPQADAEGENLRLRQDGVERLLQRRGGEVLLLEGEGVGARQLEAVLARLHSLNRSGR